MFSVQVQQLALSRYDPRKFYSSDDVWQVPLHIITAQATVPPSSCYCSRSHPRTTESQRLALLAMTTGDLLLIDFPQLHRSSVLNKCG